MKNKLCIVASQFNSQLNALTHNTRQLLKIAKQAQADYQADVIVFPESALTGYPMEDTLFAQDMPTRIDNALNELCNAKLKITLIVGHPRYEHGKIYNSASVIQQGQVIAQYDKQHLPNYQVFDEKRYFHAGNHACVFSVNGITLGVTICEDLWSTGPLTQAKQAGAQAILCLNASPFHADKYQQRVCVLQKRQQQEAMLPIIYVNSVGGQDEFLFDGGSFALDAQGALVGQAPAFEMCLATYTLTQQASSLLIETKTHSPYPETLSSVYQALVLGTRDYVRKTGFEKVVLGLSGGADSALTITIAVDALGAENVTAVMMPSRYTSKMSLEDATLLINALGVDSLTQSIDELFQTFLTNLAPVFEDAKPDVTEENLQARIRCVLLMAIANKQNRLVLSTSNKSELAVGYSTLYGDMSGGFAPLKDVYKTDVYRLIDYRNTLSPLIPTRILKRAPSAELAPNQTDQDTLPPYSTLDAILKAYIGEHCRFDELIAKGFDKETIDRVIHLITRSEYKRQQAPIGVRVSKRAFGRDWRYPVA